MCFDISQAAPSWRSTATTASSPWVNHHNSVYDQQLSFKLILAATRRTFCANFLFARAQKDFAYYQTRLPVAMRPRRNFWH